MKVQNRWRVRNKKSGHVFDLTAHYPTAEHAYELLSRSLHIDYHKDYTVYYIPKRCYHENDGAIA